MLHTRTVPSLLMALALIPLAYIYSAAAQQDTVGQDVYYVWIEGKRILNGENPYERVLQGDMINNDKYATYLPAYYLLSALTQAAGLRDYPDWITLWQLVFNTFHYAIGILIFIIFRRNKMEFVGLFGASFWWFGRWSLLVVDMAHVDFVPLFCLILAVYFFDQRRNLSLILFGTSLALKQIGILMMPLFLIWVWHRERSFKDVVLALLMISSVPLLLAAPFLIWSLEGFVKSVLFSATRRAESQLGVLSIDTRLGLAGVAARLPMFLLLIAVYIGAGYSRIRKFTSGLLTMAVFVSFNPVLFLQYFVWSAPFVPLTICDYADRDVPTKS